VLENNIIWIADNSDSLEGFQAFYSRFNSLIKNPRIPWILVNLCSGCSSDASYSDAVLEMLINSPKPIKTQIITAAESFGILFACVGEERVAWPKARFMHHSFHLDFGGSVSLEKLQKELKSVETDEQAAMEYLRSRMGDESYSRFVKEFKKKNGADFYFDAKKAVEFNIVQSIGSIEPFYIEGDANE